MSSNSYSEDCGKCGGKESLMISESNNPHSLSGDCIECGDTFWTKRGQMSLKEVNELRVDLDELKPLIKLKKQEV